MLKISGAIARMLLLLIAVGFPAAAQPAPPLVLNGLGRASAPLDGPWQFHLGDSPAYASPGLDDSSWQPVQAGQSWETQGHPDYTGYAWYRRHLILSADGPADWTMALLLPNVEDACDVYWNGDWVGSYGKTPPHPVWYWEPKPTAIPLGRAQSGVLAIRVWKAPYTLLTFSGEGGLVAVPRVGSEEAIDGLLRESHYRDTNSEEFPLLLMLVSGTIGVLALLAFLRDRSRGMLFWLALAMLTPMLRWPIDVAGLLPFRADYGLIAPVIFLYDIAVWFLLLDLLGLRSHARLVRWTKYVAVAAMSLDLLHAALQAIDWSRGHAHLLLIADIAVTTPEVMLELWGLVIVVFALRSRLDAARWMLTIAALLMELLQAFDDFTGLGARWTHWYFGLGIDTALFSVGGFSFTLRSLGDLFLLGAILFAAWRYLTEQNRRQSALEQEFSNARAVQQVLVPEDIPAVPGFAIQSVYKPYGEVGGDFFQIVFLGRGGALVVIGDVSGKGLPAAMTVSLLVGAVRTLADFIESPADILARMNKRMAGRSSGGFTTCLCARMLDNGAVTVANAGHLAPYRNGEEMAVDSGLPLGLAADAEYTESSFALAPGDVLTLLSDGVVEARTATGELFGFDRTRAISTQSAEQIAQAAQAFGQEDDITVLTLTFAPVGVLHA